MSAAISASVPKAMVWVSLSALLKPKPSSRMTIVGGIVVVVVVVVVVVLEVVEEVVSVEAVESVTVVAVGADVVDVGTVAVVVVAPALMGSSVPPSETMAAATKTRAVTSAMMRIVRF